MQPKSTTTWTVVGIALVVVVAGGYGDLKREDTTDAHTRVSRLAMVEYAASKLSDEQIRELYVHADLDDRDAAIRAIIVGATLDHSFERKLLGECSTARTVTDAKERGCLPLIRHDSRDRTSPMHQMHHSH
jgi:hypothetical protein